MDPVVEYFEQNAGNWVDDAYDSSDGLTPIGIQRIDRVKSILRRIYDGRDNVSSAALRACDLGSGDGSLCRALADEGFSVTGVDRSESMISIAQSRSESYGEQVRFVHSDIESAAEKLQQQYDVVTSMGVMYYLKDEDDFFSSLQSITKPDGVALVSCRNRLFNLFFGSRKSQQELGGDSARDLLEELYDLDFNLSVKDLLPVLELLNRYSEIDYANALPEVKQENRQQLEQVIDTVEGKQHSPKQITEIVQRNGFSVDNIYGIQPHFLAAGSSDRRARQMMKKLSEALIPLAEHPSSLMWCSHFVLELRPEK